MKPYVGLVRPLTVLLLVCETRQVVMLVSLMVKQQTTRGISFPGQ